MCSVFVCYRIKKLKYCVALFLKNLFFAKHEVRLLLTSGPTEPTFDRLSIEPPQPSLPKLHGTRFIVSWLCLSFASIVLRGGSGFFSMRLLRLPAPALNMHSEKQGCRRGGNDISIRNYESARIEHMEKRTILWHKHTAFHDVLQP